MTAKRARKTTAKNPQTDAWRDALIRVAQDAAGIWNTAGMGPAEIAEALIREYRERLADAEGHAEALESDKDDAESRETEERERADAAEEERDETRRELARLQEAAQAVLDAKDGLPRDAALKRLGEEL